MAEPTARELRRLRQLDEMIVRVRDDRDSLRAARNQLRDEVKELKLRLREGERGRQEANSHEDALIRLNQQQAEALDQAGVETSALRSETAALRAEVDGTRKEAAELRASVEELTRSLTKASKDLAETGKALNQARAQLESKDVPVILGADEVGGLVEEFLGRLSPANSGMSATGGSIHLRVGFAASSAGPGFVVPSATAAPGTIGELHDLTVELRRSPDPT